MHKCLLTYEIDGETEETFLFYEKDMAEALSKFFIFNDKRKIKIISLQLKRHYPSYMDIEEIVYLADEEPLKGILDTL